MSTFKKLFASIAAIMIVVSTAPVAVFGQTSRSAEYQAAYSYAFENGITTMASIDAANLAGTTTRAQAAKFFVNFAEAMENTKTNSDCTFSDLAPVAGTDLAAFAVEACEYGLMGINTNGIFNPNGTLSRGEFGTILSRVLFGDVYNGGNPFYAAHLNALNQAGLMNDLSNPERSIMRGDAMLLLFRSSTADLDGMTPGFCADIETVFACTIDTDGSMGLCPAACLGNTEPTEPTDPTDSNWEVKVGEVTVGLSPSSVGARSVPNTGLIPFGTFEIKAGSSSVEIASISFKREGLSNRSDIRRIHLERNGVRISSRANISTDDTSMVSFSPALAIPAGGMEALTLVVELDSLGATVGALHNFAILSANSLNSSANVYGNYPIKTATATISSYTVDTVDVNVVAVTSTQNVGDENVSFGEISIQTA